MSLLSNPHNPAALPPSEARTLRQLRIEARKAHGFGKPRAAALMEALARVIAQADTIYAIIERWPGDLASDGVIFRLNAGLHDFALSDHGGVLGALYGNGALPDEAQLDRALARVLGEHADALAGWLAHPTQTNEVARVAGLVAALGELARHDGLGCEVLELGASAGLNLNFPHYAIDLGGARIGSDDAKLVLAPDWRGRAAAPVPLDIIAARGVDLHPLDVANAADCRSLAAYLWPGEAARSARLAAALDIARAHPPKVDTGLASAWLLQRFAEPQAPRTRRVVFHSMVLQYASAAERAAIDLAFSLVGARAEPDRPLARVSLEWRADRGAVELRVAQWNGAQHRGESRLAALCHPYGEWIDWRGLA